MTIVVFALKPICLSMNCALGVIAVAYKVIKVTYMRLNGLWWISSEML